MSEKCGLGLWTVLVVHERQLLFGKGYDVTVTVSSDDAPIHRRSDALKETPSDVYDEYGWIA